MDAIGLVTALGGLEFVKWLFTRRRQNRTDEFHLLKETIEFLQGQLQQKEERFAEQTQLVRKQNLEIIELTNENAQLKLELSKKKCEDISCPFREPPNAYTKPHPGTTKENYHLQKQRQNAEDN